MNLRLISCVGVDLELPHLAHFLRHYAGLGVPPSNMHVIANTRDPGSRNLASATRALEECGCPAPRRWIAPYTSDTMWRERRRLQQDVARPGDWILNADVDEHHRYPGAVLDVVRYCERKGHNSVQGFLVDRLAPEGELRTVADAPALREQFPLEAEVHLHLLERSEHHGVDSTTKLMLHEASVLPGRGGHVPSAEGAAPSYLHGARLGAVPRATDPAYRFGFPFRVDHYKWTATREATFRNRISTPGVSEAGREVGGALTRYLGEHGRIRPEDVALAGETGARASSLSWRLASLQLRLAARLRRIRGGSSRGEPRRWK